MVPFPLPDRPDLAQLRRRAKELRRSAAGGDASARERLAAVAGHDRPPTLALAQLAIAREHGFASWPRLVAEVERRTQTVAERANAFLAAVADDRPNRAARILGETPAVSGYDVFAAAAAGDAPRVRAFLDQDRSLATRRDTRRDLSALLYAAATRLGDPRATVEALLEGGAGPEERGENLTALYAAVRADSPEVVALLLDRDADPDDGDSLYHSTELDDHACLRELLAHGATESGSAALAHMLDADDAEGTRLLLEHGADATDPNLLRHAIWRDCGAAVVRLLLEHGADPRSPGVVPAWVDPVGSGWPPAGISTLRLAVRKGRPDVASLLREHGAVDDSTPADALIDACMRADRDGAAAIVSPDPGLVARLEPADQAAICDAAHYGRDAGVELMLDLGFPLDATGDYGGTPLHLAAMRGRADLVRVLLARGADPNGLDSLYRSTPLQWTLMGNPRWGHPDCRWPEVARHLLAAGATTSGVWLPDDGPLADVLAEAGVER